MSPLEPDHQSQAPNVLPCPLCVVIHILLPSENTALSTTTYFCLPHLDKPSWAESTLHLNIPMTDVFKSNKCDKRSLNIFHVKKIQSYPSLSLLCECSVMLNMKWSYTFQDGKTQTSNYLEFLLPPIYEHLLYSFTTGTQECLLNKWKKEIASLGTCARATHLVEMSLLPLSGFCLYLGPRS